MNGDILEKKIKNLPCFPKSCSSTLKMSRGLLSLDSYAGAQVFDWGSSVRPGLKCSLQSNWPTNICCLGSTPNRWGDIAASVSDLCVPQKWNCIGGFCTQAVFLFEAGEISLEVHCPALNVVCFRYFDIGSSGKTEKLFCDIILLILKWYIYLGNHTSGISSYWTITGNLREFCLKRKFAKIFFWHDIQENSRQLHLQSREKTE